MSNAVLNIFVRVIDRRISNGETFDDIINSYAKLTNEDKKIIANTMNIDDEER